VLRNHARRSNRSRATKNLLGGIVERVDLAKTILERATNVEENFIIYRFPNKPTSNEQERTFFGRSHKS